MTYVVTLAGSTPSPRFNGTPWTQIAVEEASSNSGPWTRVDTQALSPLDADPTQPQARSVTTENATLANGYYRLAFLDDDGNQEITAGVASAPAGVAVVVDPSDVRVLIPKVTRAIYGPTGVDLDAEQQLDPGQVGDLIADTIAKLIFFTNGLWPYQLGVTARDSIYQSPIGWRILSAGQPAALPIEDETLIVTQAALDFFFFEFKDKKVSEEISDEGQKWGYSLSASVLQGQLQNLRAERDRALQAIEQRQDFLVDYVSFINERDALTGAVVEWWVRAGLTYPSGQEVFPGIASFGA